MAASSFDYQFSCEGVAFVQAPHRLTTSNSQNPPSQHRNSSLHMGPTTPIDSSSFLSSQFVGMSKSTHSLIPMRPASNNNAFVYPFERSPSCCNAMDGLYDSSGMVTPHQGPRAHWSNVVPLLSICASDFDLPLPSPEVGRRGHKEPEMIWLVNTNDASLRSAAVSRSVVLTPEKPKRPVEATQKPQAHFHPSPFMLWQSLPPPMPAAEPRTVAPTEATSFAQVKATSATDNKLLNDTVVPNHVYSVTQTEDSTVLSTKFRIASTAGLAQRIIVDNGDSHPEPSTVDDAHLAFYPPGEACDFWANITLPCPLNGLQTQQMSGQPKPNGELGSLSTFLSSC
eukprot:GILI01013540.1.p1 GENE.GILI01013540.1~~GILI01013540.1.p1  ORF type:complete len:340 (+),score=27.45 GILI01013540.1:128-1147(+)